MFWVTAGFLLLIEISAAVALTLMLSRLTQLGMPLHDDDDNSNTQINELQVGDLLLFGNSNTRSSRIIQGWSASCWSHVAVVVHLCNNDVWMWHCDVNTQGIHCRLCSEQNVTGAHVVSLREYLAVNNGWVHVVRSTAVDRASQVCLDRCLDRCRRSIRFNSDPIALLGALFGSRRGDVSDVLDQNAQTRYCSQHLAIEFGLAPTSTTPKQLALLW